MIVAVSLQYKMGYHDYLTVPYSSMRGFPKFNCGFQHWYIADLRISLCFAHLQWASDTAHTLQNNTNFANHAQYVLGSYSQHRTIIDASRTTTRANKD